MKRTIVLVALMFVALAGCGESGVQGARDSEAAEGSGTRAETTIGAPKSTIPAEETTGTPTKLQKLTIEASGGEEVEVRVEIADDTEEQAQGLMNRESLGEKRGMLFAYLEEQEMAFWMRNTYIPLSIAYIDSERRIVDIQDMKPLDDKPPSYVSAEPAQYALEVNKGFFDERGIKVGDEVRLPE